MIFSAERKQFCQNRTRTEDKSELCARDESDVLVLLCLLTDAFFDVVLEGDVHGHELLLALDER